MSLYNSNHSNNSVIDESCDPAVIVINENDGGVTQLGGSAANIDIESMKSPSAGPDCFGSIDNNQFLSNNNNSNHNNNHKNNLDTNVSHKMLHKSDVNVNLSASANEMARNRSNQCLNEFGMIEEQQQQSLMQSASEQKVLHHSNANIDIIVDGDGDGGNGDDSNIDKYYSTKSNSSQIEIDVETQDEHETDEQKPILNGIKPMPTTLTNNNSHSEWNGAAKLVTDSIQSYSNCETDSLSIDGHTISDKMDSAILKKEVSRATYFESYFLSVGLSTMKMASCLSPQSDDLQNQRTDYIPHFVEDFKVIERILNFVFTF